MNTHFINNIVSLEFCAFSFRMLENGRLIISESKSIAWHLYQRKDLKSANAFHATAESESATIRKNGFQQKIYCIPNGVIVRLT